MPLLSGKIKSKNKSLKKLILVVGIFFSSLTIFAQEVDRSYYIWFDQQVGKHNTGLSNGTRYIESYRIYKGRHQFYLTSNYIKGDIIYFGQRYFDIDLKYDLYENQIIIALIDEDASSIIKLVKDQISG